MIRKLWSRVRELSAENKFYVAGGMMFAVYAVMSFALSISKNAASTEVAASLAAPLILAFFAIAVLIESARIVDALWEDRWFKIALALVAFIVYSMAKVEADSFINDLTSLDPEKLPQAQTLLTSLFVIPSWVSVLLLILVLLLLGAMFSFPFFLVNDKKQSTSGLRIARLVGLIGTVAALVWVEKQYKDEQSLVNALLKEAILSAEYHPKSACTNVGSGQLVADLGDGLISVFTRGTLTFQVEKCAFDEKEALGQSDSRHQPAKL